MKQAGLGFASRVLLAAAALLAVSCSAKSYETLGKSEQALTQSLPFRIRGIDYTAFNDSDTVHEGNCGSGPVDAETTSDPNGGTCNIGWTKSGEWLEYSIQVGSAKKFNIVSRVASASTGKTFRILIDGTAVGGSQTVPSAGWQAFADRTLADVSLAQGTHTLRVLFETGDTNLNYLDISPGSVSLPRRIEAEDYQRSFDSTPASNFGNACNRGDGVDKETTGDFGGGCDVGWTTPGEWLEYSVQVASAGKFDIVSRVASAATGKTFRVSVDGTSVGGSQTVPSAGWQAFADRTLTDVSLTQGAHAVRVLFETGDTNLNYIDVTPGTVTLPARIEAEDYQRAFESTPTSNSGNACDRADGVDKEVTGDLTGGCNIGWTTAGEWLEYDIKAPQTGLFDLTARVGSAVTGRTVQISVDGSSVGTVSSPSTGWTKFEDRKLENINLSAGTHVVRVLFVQGDTNLNYLNLAPHGAGCNSEAAGSCSDGNACNGVESCDGSGKCVAGSPPILDDGNPCTSDSCDPVTGVKHSAVADGTACSDGNACNGAELCAIATCTAGTALVVDDSNPCTADSCDSKTGVHHAPVATGTSCADGNACNGSEACDSGGTCVASAAPIVDDGNPCTADSCDPAVGVKHAAVAAGTSCSDGNACNGAESCNGAEACALGTPPPVNDNNPCTVDSCDVALGVRHVPLGAGTSCSDGNACNGSEACDASGACLPGSPLAVDDGNPCTADSCVAASGVKHTPLAQGAACSDGNACNGSELCSGSGACVAGTAPTVDDHNPCTADSCDPATGVAHAPVAANTACDDGDACNGHESCNAIGFCSAGPPLAVDDGNPCTADSCSDGSVKHSPVPSGTSCSDSNACNGAEACDASGGCIAGPPLALDDGNACTTDTCDPAAGVKHSPASNGTACDDGTVCNGHEACQAGACVVGAALVVDDHNPCTVDTCDPATGASHSPVALGTSCPDANSCNGDELCDSAGQCQAGTPVTVDDGNPCTADTCSAAGGVKHAFLAQGAACPDGNACNGSELCNGSGVCVAGTAPVVDDGNPCTADSCDPVGGVSHAPVTAGIACDDADACNGHETCNAIGFCSAGTPLPVDDGNPCTADTCDAQGVKHALLAAGTACADSNACHGAGTCDASGSCAVGAPLPLDDGNPCTTDSCDPTSGVKHARVAAGSNCDDGNLCNGVNLCSSAGVCLTGTAPVIDDGNPCTTDSCDSVTGLPVHQNLPADTSCADANFCNGAEKCNSAGACIAGAPVSCGSFVCSGSACPTSCTTNAQCTNRATDSCHAVACDASTGQCGLAPKADGTACSSIDACFINTVCSAGQCTGGTPVSVDDHNPCTTDTCDAITGPSHMPAPSGASCSDGIFCNGQETCNGSGQCVAGPALSLSDGNPCTEDVCNGSANKIEHLPFSLGTACDDSTVCNGREVCDGHGQCVAGTPAPLDDAKPCTVDSCDPVAGVTHVALASGTACDDTTVCNGHESCDASGACVAGSALPLDDGNPCTADTCDPVLGVSHPSAQPGTSCSDGNACNGDERCNAAGSCAAGAPLAIDDGKPCTQDSCDPATGAVTNKPLSGGTSCANANLCDGAESCDGNGVCSPGVALLTDDGDTCTLDSCDPLVGVKHVRSTASGCAAPGQWQTLIASQPSPRDGAAGVFTSAGELFVYGGENAGASLGDSWLWSAAQNGWRRAAAGPPARAGATAAFDSQRQRVIVVGGVSGAEASSSYLNEVWEYAPATDAWSLRSPPTAAPPVRALASFAYDSQNQRGLLFGGVGPTHLADTWEWVGATGAWTQLSGQGPSARFGSAFAFDPAHHVYVLFGGSPQGVTGGALNDTWQFDANTGLWSQRNPAIKPPPRAGASMTYDASVSRLVLVGGTSLDILNANDAWEFDAGSGNWTQLGTSAAPAQTGAIAGFDPSAGKLLLATGLAYSDSGRFSTDSGAIWTYSRASQQWFTRSSSSAPARINLAAAFNSDTGRIVTRSTVDQSDTSTRPMMWDYDGSARQWYAIDVSAGRTDFGSGAFKEAANVVNGLIYDSDRHLTLQITTIAAFFPDFGRVRLREWDGAQWKAGCDVAATNALDIGMDKASAIYDPVRKLVRLFGYGKVVTINPVNCAATMQFIGSPQVKESAALGWDAERDVFVLFGGVSSSEPQADTWEFDPISSSWTAGGAGPSARSGAALAYDSVRKKLVLYGGAFLSGPARRDTWEYSVSTHSWSQLNPGGGPDKVRAWVVFDAKRKQSLLVGTDGSLWAWNGATWDPEFNSVAPSARSGMSGGWDPTLGVGVFFGGMSGDGRRAFLSDVWLWSGGWHQASAPGDNSSPLQWGHDWQSQGRTVVAAGPAGRTGHVLATGYTGSSYAALLFGGEADTGLLGDTWTLDEASLQWESRTSSSPMFDPSARTGHAASLFPARGYVLFGGLTRTSGGQDTLLNDTWFWIGNWSQMSLSGTLPSARYGHAMATDEVSKQVILFGGRDASGVVGDTWLLNLNTLQSSGWQKLNPANAPRPRFGHAMSYDSVRGRIVLTGGEGALPGQAFGDTWEWDSSSLTWIRRNLPAMDGRAGQVAFFDKNFGQTVLFGGFAHDATGHAARTHGDTLAFLGANQVDPIGLKQNGDQCSLANTCESGLCVDGVCCNTACTGQCAACDVAGLQGTCSAATGAPHGSRPSCGGAAGTCGASCDGSDTTACHPATTGTSCGAAIGCNNGSLIQGAGVCNGAGVCSQAATSCLPYTCFGPPDLPTPQCATKCFSDGYCFSADYRCSRPDGGVCYLAAKILGLSITPAVPKVGVPVTITLQGSLPNATYRYRFINQADKLRFVCESTTNKSCTFTPLPADVGAGSITVFAQAPPPSTSGDDEKTIPLTIGAQP